MITHAVLDLLPRVCGLSGLAVYVVDDVLLLMTGLALVVVPGHLRREAIR
jgi:hypothetical protein